MAGGKVKKGQKTTGIVRHCQPFTQTDRAQLGCVRTICFDRNRRGGPDPAGRCTVAVVVEYQRPLISRPVTIGKDVFIHAAVMAVKIIQGKIFRSGEELAALQEREDPELMPSYQSLIYGLVPIGPPVLHAVFFVKPLDLSMADHR